MLTYYFVEWTLHGFGEVKKDVKGIWAVPYANGAMLRPETVHRTDTVRFYEDAVAKNMMRLRAGQGLV